MPAKFDLGFTGILFGRFGIYAMLKRERVVMLFAFFKQCCEFIFEITRQQRTLAWFMLNAV